MSNLSTSKSAKYRARKRALGICLHCPNKARTNKAYCLDCQNKTIIRRRRRVAIQLANGEISLKVRKGRHNKHVVMEHYGPCCKICGESMLPFLNIDHINNNGAFDRRNGQNGGYDLYSRLIKQGFPAGYQCLCWNCNYRKDLERRLRQAKDKKASYRLVYRTKLITEVFNNYGGPTCSCCGLADCRVLTIDHIDGGGKRHKESLRANTIKFYCWLRLSGFPDGYRVLCRNCNCGRELNEGTCPHYQRCSNST